MSGRKLLYVPIIHVEADLGSLAEPVARTSHRIYGQARWERHQETVKEFWDSIAAHFEGSEAAGLKVYQDGLLAEGELGRRIIDEGARSGSRNFEVVKKLMERGAEIRKTEEACLLREECECLMKMVHSRSAWGKLWAYLQYKLRQRKLLTRRDKFIAGRINETLKAGETGVLFLGAYHDVLPHLSRDIEVKELKERERVKTYVGLLRRRRDQASLDRVADYLAAPVRCGG